MEYFEFYPDICLTIKCWIGEEAAKPAGKGQNYLEDVSETNSVKL